MLQYRTVEPATLELLIKLMQLPELKNFYLVVGTCLALRYGHRKSIDLDLFSVTDFDNDDIIKVLEQKFPGFVYRSSDQGVGIFGFIDDVKIDLVKHHAFKQIGTPEEEGGIRMFSDRDIVAMKVFAILKRAEKKDFWDLAELLQVYTVQDIITFYQEKYPSSQLLITVPQAITYFADAEESVDPVSLKGQTWENVKESIRQKVKEYLQ